jgi:polyferredoxin
VAVLGVWLNLQYSSQQVLSLLGFDVPRTWSSGSFFLIVGVPVAVVLFGNVYCGYLCPFGALQELIGELRPARFASDPRRRVWRYGRAVKYGLLFLLVGLFAMTRDYGVLSADPLITVFSVVRTPVVILLAVAVLALCVPYRRFWCRNLCPAGAFLSLLNRFRLLRQLSPAAQPRHCDLGVQNAAELDCIRCDRCLHGKK